MNIMIEADAAITFIERGTIINSTLLFFNSVI
jgi:hypothetical protein